MEWVECTVQVIQEQIGKKFGNNIDIYSLATASKQNIKKSLARRLPATASNVQIPNTKALYKFSTMDNNALVQSCLTTPKCMKT